MTRKLKNKTLSCAGIMKRKKERKKERKKHSWMVCIRAIAIALPVVTMSISAITALAGVR